MAQIFVSPFPDAAVRNLKNSKAQNEKDAKLKIEDIMARLRRNEDFASLAQNYSEDPNTSPNGGDMGFVRESDLEKANPELRKMVISLPPNAVSPIIHTQEGYRILKVVTKEPAGQRELNDPRVQQSIRETLINSKNNLLQSAYYEVARNGTKIENYLARSVVDDLVAKVKEMYAAFGRGDVDGIMQHLADNVLWESEGPAELGFTGIRHGRQETLGFFEGIAREHADPKLIMNDFVGSGDSVAVFGRYECTLRRSGRRVDTPVGHLFQFRDGKVVRYINLVNTADYVQASAAA
jgi:ketosteroid isomerase-like protein